MRSIEESIEALTKAINSEAHAESEQVLAGAKLKAETIRQNAQEQVVRLRAEILEHASGEAERVRRQAIATAQLQARTLQLERREKLLDSVFEAARQRLSDMPQSPDYDKNARNLLQEALTHLADTKAKVRADEQTQMAFTKQVLAEISKQLGVQIQLGAVLEIGTGVIVETLDGHRQYDNTLEARLSRLQNELRSPVYHLLRGESV